MRSDGKDWCCQNCGEKQPVGDAQTVRTEARESKGMKIIDEEKYGGTLPTTDVECPKCGHNKAAWRLRQMRAADEPETRIFRCTKCQHTWRDNA
jgi:DNA-directed RNA polymerase subunit M